MLFIDLQTYLLYPLSAAQFETWELLLLVKETIMEEPKEQHADSLQL